IVSISSLQDPLLNSVFRQGKFVQFDTASKTLDISFSKELTFFKDWLHETAKLWAPLLTKAFGGEIIVNTNFDIEPLPKSETKVAVAKPVHIQPSIKEAAPANQKTNYKNVATTTNNNQNRDGYKSNFQKPFTPQKKFVAKIQNN